MSETDVDARSLGVTPVKDDAATAVAKDGSDPKPQTAASSTTLDSDQKREASEWDEQVKAAIRKNVVNHELACLVVDLTSPGAAVVQMGGSALNTLPPIQHLLIATAAIGGVLLMSNPDLLAKLKGSMGRGKTADKQLPDQRAVAAARAASSTPVAAVSQVAKEQQAQAAARGDPLVALGVRSLLEAEGEEL